MARVWETYVPRRDTNRRPRTQDLVTTRIQRRTAVEMLYAIAMGHLDDWGIEDAVARERARQEARETKEQS